MSAAGINEAGSVAGSKTAAIPPAPPRNIAIDTYRGFVMLLMMAEIVQFCHIARAFPGNWFWEFSAITRRTSSGRAFRCTTDSARFVPGGRGAAVLDRSRPPEEVRSSPLFGHALWRSLLLVALGIFLRSCITGRSISRLKTR